MQNKNKNKNKIYLVTLGTYSDYRVCGVFTTKTQAKKYINKFTVPYEEYNIFILDIKLFTFIYF